MIQLLNTTSYAPNYFEEVFVIKKSKKNVEEEIIGTFYKKGLQKTTETEFKIEKLIKEIGQKLYFK